MTVSKYSISILGSCVSRDLFNSHFVSNYDVQFEVLSDQQHMSIISLMSPPLSKNLSDISGDITTFYKHNFQRDLNKNYLEELKYNPPEFLLIDFYTDAFYGTVEEKSGSYITNKLWQYKKLGCYRELEIGKEYSVYNNSLEFIELWKNYFDLFMVFINEYCPKTKIIINKAKFVNRYLDSKKDKMVTISDVTDDKWKAFHIDRFNIIWNLFDTYAIEKYNLDSIDFDMNTYYGNPFHKWGLFYVHYNQEFYNDTYQKLLIIVDRSKCEC